MKTLLFLSWLALGGVGYFGYGFYNDTMAKQAASDQALQTLSDKNKALIAENDSLEIQLNTEKSNEASLRQSSSATAVASPVAPAPQADATPGSFVFPTTITTISGTTYQNCKFDQACCLKSK